MPTPSSPLPCPACEGLNTATIEVRPDPDHRIRQGAVLVRAPTVWRVRVCGDCGAMGGSAEVPIALSAVQNRLAELAGERYRLRRLAAAG